jgi:hypothetical protein
MSLAAYSVAAARRAGMRTQGKRKAIPSALVIALIAPTEEPNIGTMLQMAKIPTAFIGELFHEARSPRMKLISSTTNRITSTSRIALFITARVSTP